MTNPSLSGRGEGKKKEIQCLQSRRGQCLAMVRVRTEKFADALNRLGTLRPDAPLGVLDIGSNSVRLVGYSGSARTPLPIYNERAFCRLGEAVSATGRIEGEPYNLALMTFQRFRAIAERWALSIWRPLPRPLFVRRKPRCVRCRSGRNSRP